MGVLARTPVAAVVDYEVRTPVAAEGVLAHTPVEAVADYEVRTPVEAVVDYGVHTQVVEGVDYEVRSQEELDYDVLPHDGYGARYRDRPLVAYHIPACYRDRYLCSSFFS